jgi:hypothetical protein
VNEIQFLIQFVGATALIAAPAILISRLLANADGGTLADLFAIPLDPPWPHGVQEEEPIRWRMQALRQRPRVDDAIDTQGGPMLADNRSTP